MIACQQGEAFREAPVAPYLLITLQVEHTGP